MQTRVSSGDSRGVLLADCLHTGDVARDFRVCAACRSRVTGETAMPASEGLGDRDWGTSLSLRDVLTVVFKRRWIIIIVTAVGVGRCSRCLPPASPIVRSCGDPAREQGARRGALGADRLRAGHRHAVDEKELNSEVEILKSRKLIEEVLEIVGVDGVGDRRDAAMAGGGLSAVWSAVRSAFAKERPSRPFDQMVVALQREHRRSARSARSNVIRVGYRSDGPRVGDPGRADSDGTLHPAARGAIPVTAGRCVLRGADARRRGATSAE